MYALERLALFEMLTITTAEDRSFRVAIDLSFSFQALEPRSFRHSFLL